MVEGIQSLNIFPRNDWWCLGLLWERSTNNSRSSLKARSASARWETEGAEGAKKTQLHLLRSGSSPRSSVAKQSLNYDKRMWIRIKSIYDPSLVSMCQFTLLICMDGGHFIPLMSINLLANSKVSILYKNVWFNTRCNYIMGWREYQLIHLHLISKPPTSDPIPSTQVPIFSMQNLWVNEE